MGRYCIIGQHIEKEEKFNDNYAKHAGLFGSCQDCVTKEINRRKQMVIELKMQNVECKVPILGGINKSVVC